MIGNGNVWRRDIKNAGKFSPQGKNLPLDDYVKLPAHRAGHLKKSGGRSPHLTLDLYA